VINYLFLESTDSTQRWAKRHLKELDLSAMTCIYTSSQTDGIGVHGHKWYSPSTENIYATFVFSVPAALHHIGNLAQLLSLSAAFVLEEHKISPILKWPNDLMLDGKKLGGILCETTTEKENVIALAGIGLNVNMPAEDLALIDQPATSLLAHTNHSWNYKELLCQIGDRFLVDLEQYEEEGFVPFYEAYCKRMRYIGSPLHIEGQRALIESIYPDGRLVVVLPSGEKIITATGSIE